jgi:hypothetical protein
MVNKKFCDKCGKEINGEYFSRTTVELNTEYPVITGIGHDAEDICMTCNKEGLR